MCEIKSIFTDIIISIIVSISYLNNLVEENDKSVLSNIAHFVLKMWKPLH